jgi:hypothetical protein
MAYASLNNEGQMLIDGNDSIVIVNNFESIKGGRTLNVTGFAPTTIPAGHVIIKETATGDYKPMPISGTAYDALPSGHTYAGINVATVLKTRPFCGIMVRGTVNTVASPYTIASILSAVKTALPQVIFTNDTI